MATLLHVPGLGRARSGLLESRRARIVTINPSSPRKLGRPGSITLKRLVAVPRFCFLLGREEFIVIVMIVMACGLVLPGGAA